MRSFYTDGDVAAKRAFLQQYDVRYVIVGQTETLCAAGRRCQVLVALGHALQRRSRTVQLKEKAEHAMTRNGVQAQLTWT